MYSYIILYSYIYIYTLSSISSYIVLYYLMYYNLALPALLPKATAAATARPRCTPADPRWIRSISEISSCFFGPRPWHIEIRHRVKQTSTIDLFGFETLPDAHRQIPAELVLLIVIWFVLYCHYYYYHYYDYVYYVYYYYYYYDEYYYTRLVSNSAPTWAFRCHFTTCQF